MPNAHVFPSRSRTSAVAGSSRIGVGLSVPWLAACLWAGSAAAAAPQTLVAAESGNSASAQSGTAAAEPPGFLAGISRRNYLLGDMGGLRTLLGRYGMSVNLQETSEVLGNVTGGARQGFDYDGLTQMALQLDTQRAFGWQGGTFNASALQIHGRSLSADNLLTLQTASGIEADRATRLWELWYQQEFPLEDRLDLKIGQQSLDQEFMVSQNALLFVNTMFGWPMLPSADMPGGGPAYPLSALGLRVRAHPADSLTLLAGVFNGSPARNNIGDLQQQNPSGTSFPLNGGALAIAEVQFAHPSPGTKAGANPPRPLAGVYRFGLWYDTEDFADLAVDNTGRSLANPASTGIPQGHRGDYAFYAVADQAVWQDATEPDRTLNVFVRAMGSPLADRNLIDFSLNAGITFHEPFLHRADDSVGVGMGYAHVSGRVAALDRDTASFTGAFTPVRSGETFIEVTYQYQVTPWWQLQPDFQYVFNPGGGVANPNASEQQVQNEAVIGLRTTILF
ncbi:MAG TPA: carbohydrate porin [Stellaceae bacterium]|nr:carbohydrate porin [Stellaceae bacterium]